MKPSFFWIYIVIAVSNLASTVYSFAIDSFSAIAPFSVPLCLCGEKSFFLRFRVAQLASVRGLASPLL